jgi:hypothetical protein
MRVAALDLPTREEALDVFDEMAAEQRRAVSG